MTPTRRNAILLIAAVICAFIAIIPILPIHMESVKNGGPQISLNRELRNEVVSKTKGMTDEQIMRYGLKKTASLLRYTVKNDIENGKANCVGYAQLYAAICNVGFGTNNSASKAKAVRGNVFLFGINLCNFLKFLAPGKMKDFVKDHDFVEFKLKNRTVNQDACFYDLIHNNSKTLVRTNNN